MMPSRRKVGQQVAQVEARRRGAETADIAARAGRGENHGHLRSFEVHEDYAPAPEVKPEPSVSGRFTERDASGR